MLGTLAPDPPDAPTFDGGALGFSGLLGLPELGGFEVGLSEVDEPDVGACDVVTVEASVDGVSESGASDVGAAGVDELEEVPVVEVSVGRGLPVAANTGDDMVWMTGTLHTVAAEAMAARFRKARRSTSARGPPRSPVSQSIRTPSPCPLIMPYFVRSWPHVHSIGPGVVEGLKPRESGG